MCLAWGQQDGAGTGRADSGGSRPLPGVNEFLCAAHLTDLSTSLTKDGEGPRGTTVQTHCESGYRTGSSTESPIVHQGGTGVGGRVSRRVLSVGSRTQGLDSPVPRLEVDW